MPPSPTCETPERALEQLRRAFAHITDVIADLIADAQTTDLIANAHTVPAAAIDRLRDGVAEAQALLHQGSPEAAWFDLARSVRWFAAMTLHKNPKLATDLLDTVRAVDVHRLGPEQQVMRGLFQTAHLLRRPGVADAVTAIKEELGRLAARSGDMRTCDEQEP
jgi:hypothetical protein